MTEENALKLVIEFLNRNEAFSIGSLVLFLEGDLLTVTGWSTTFHLENITRQSAIADLDDTKQRFTELLNRSTELADFIKGKKVEYGVNYDTGKGAITICKELAGEIIWFHKMI